MSPELRRLSLKLLVTLYALHIIVNRALPSLSLVNGWRASLPDWIGLFLANAATLVVVVVLADLGLGIFKKNAFSGAVLVLLAVLGLAVPLLAVPSGSTYLLAVGIVSTVMLFGGLAVTHHLPLRAYHALAWLCTTVALSQAFAIRGHAMPSDWSFWVVGSIHVMVFFSCAAVFGAWGVPSR